MNDRCSVWGNPDRGQNSAYGLLRPFSEVLGFKVSGFSVQASGGVRMRLRVAEQRTAEPQNKEPQNFEGWFRFAHSFL